MSSTLSDVIKKLLLLFLVLSGLYFAKEFLIPLALGSLLATLFLPVCKKMESVKIPRIIAAIICLFILLSVIAGIGALLNWQISNLSNDINLLKSKGAEILHAIQQYIIREFGISVKEQTQIIQNQQSSVSGFIEIVAGSMINLFTGSVLTFVYIVLLLYYRTHIKNFIYKVSGNENKLETEKLINSAARVSQQYLTGLAKMIFCLWIMYGIGFTLIGVENALFFAILCGLLEIVPFIGNLTGTTITVLVAAVGGAGFPVLGGIVFTYGVVQFIQGWVLEPLIVGPHVKINPLFTILALVVGEIIWGIPGIVLAIPLVAILKIIFDQIEALKPYGFLIGEIETKKSTSGFTKTIKRWIK